MKPVGRLAKFIPFGILAAAITFISSAEAKVNMAVVRAVRGTASYSIDHAKTWKPIKVGFRFHPDTIIRTGVASTVDLFLDVNGPVVRVTENTQLGIDKLDYDKGETETVIETELNLTNGRILGNVKKLADASKYSVKTPLGVAGIRGTEYDISADGTVHVISGTVVVVYINRAQPDRPTVVTVHAGETAHPPVRPGEVAVVEPTPPNMKTQIDTAVADVTRVTLVYSVANNPPTPKESPVQPGIERGLPTPTSATTIEPIQFVSPINGAHAPEHGGDNQGGSHGNQGSQP